jgi:hypothetical protein
VNETNPDAIENVLKESCSLSTTANIEIEMSQENNHKVLNYKNICTTLDQQKQQLAQTNQQQSNVESKSIFILKYFFPLFYLKTYSICL